jgi:hypothetical protein
MVDIIPILQNHLSLPRDPTSNIRTFVRLPVQIACTKPTWVAVMLLKWRQSSNLMKAFLIREGILK